MSNTYPYDPSKVTLVWGRIAHHVSTCQTCGATKKPAEEVIEMAGVNKPDVRKLLQRYGMS